jgi:pSer/pThr/pTyr-binding forkhead associated (FHA) protein
MLKLFLVDGEQNRTVVPLLRSEITIGRGEGNTIRLTDQNISRVHARLVRTASGYALEDLSRYGIEGPNGPIRGTTTVASGETYRIGDYLLEFKEERASLPLPAARPRPTLSTPATSAPGSSAFASTESAPVAASLTPPGTGTAVFLADDIDNALSALDSKPSAPSAPSEAASMPLEFGGSTAGSLAVEPEPVVERPSSVTSSLQPPAAPPATSPSTVAISAPSSASEEVATEPARSTMTLRPTSVQAMKLVGQTAPFGGAELQLTLPRLVIGSGASCDVVLEHNGIAPEHLALRYDGTSWWADALSGQVRVDGDLVPTSKLWKGAVITLGGLDFRFADPLERQSVRLAPLPAPATAAAASWSPPATRDVDGEFDAAVLNRGKRNQKIGIGVGVALALGIVGLLATGGKDEAAPSAGSGVAEAEVVKVAPSIAAGSGSGAALVAAAGSGSGAGVAEVAAVAPDAAAKAAEEAKLAADAKAAEEAKAASDAKIAQEAKAAADAAALARTAQAAADKKAAAAAERAEKAAAARQAAADRKAAADAAKADRAAKAAEAAAARAARQAPKQAAPARAATPAPARAAAPAPAPARPPAAAPAKATPPAPFQEVAPAAPAAPPAPTAASLISDAKRAAVQGNRRDAVKFLEQARRLDPKNAEVNQLLFSNYRALGNTLRASEAVKRYLALKPNDSQRGDYEKWLEQNATP